MSHELDYDFPQACDKSCPANCDNVHDIVLLVGNHNPTSWDKILVCNPLRDTNVMILLVRQDTFCQQEIVNQFGKLKIPDVKKANRDTKQCLLGKLGNSIFEGTWEIEISEFAGDTRNFFESPASSRIKFACP